MNGQLVIELASGGTFFRQIVSDVVNRENDTFEITEERGVSLVSVIPMGMSGVGKRLESIQPSRKKKMKKKRKHIFPSFPSSLTISAWRWDFFKLCGGTNECPICGESINQWPSSTACQPVRLRGIFPIVPTAGETSLGILNGTTAHPELILLSPSSSGFQYLNHGVLLTSTVLGRVAVITHSMQPTFLCTWLHRFNHVTIPCIMYACCRTRLVTGNLQIMWLLKSNVLFVVMFTMKLGSITSKYFSNLINQDEHV